MSQEGSPRPGGQELGAEEAGVEVDVILTVHNGGTLLHATVESVLAQSHDAFRFTIVDDGSDDGTPGYLASLTDPRIRVQSPGRVGRGMALALAARAGTAPWIAVIDADDPAHPRRLEYELTAAGDRPEFDVLCSQTQLLYGDQEPRWASFGDRGAVPVEDLTWRLVAYNPVPHSSVLMRRTAYEAVGGYPVEARSQLDYRLWGRMLARGSRIGRIPWPLQAKRLHDAQHFETRNRVRYLAGTFEAQVYAGRTGFGVPRPLMAALAGLRFAYGLLPGRARRAPRLALRSLRGTIEAGGERTGTR